MAWQWCPIVQAAVSNGITQLSNNIAWTNRTEFGFSVAKHQCYCRHRISDGIADEQRFWHIEFDGQPARPTYRHFMESGLTDRGHGTLGPSARTSGIGPTCLVLFCDLRRRYRRAIDGTASGRSSRIDWGRPDYRLGARRSLRA